MECIVWPLIASATFYYLLSVFHTMGYQEGYRNGPNWSLKYAKVFNESIALSRLNSFKT
jgi:hypothetical protein